METTEDQDYELARMMSEVKNPSVRRTRHFMEPEFSAAYRPAAPLRATPRFESEPLRNPFESRPQIFSPPRPSVVRTPVNLGGVGKPPTFKETAVILESRIGIPAARITSFLDEFRGSTKFNGLLALLTAASDSDSDKSYLRSILNR